mgnify:CR=1 FL=1
MCFLAIYRLMDEVSIRALASLLWDLGYSINIRGNVVEGVYCGSHIRVEISGEMLKLESNDYGSRCLEDLAKVISSLRLKGYGPKLIVLRSPYILSLESERGETRRLLSKLGLRVNEVYSGYCG